MPTNIGSEALSTMKLGEAAVDKAYIGVDQIFPNETEITAAAYDNASIGNTGGTTPYSVTGDIGSSFTLAGSAGATAPVGTQVLTSSPSTYTITVGTNDGCGDPSRSPLVTIAPQGASVLATGLSPTDTISQSGGPAYTSCNTNIAITATNLVYNTVTVGGTVYWTAGASWLVQAVIWQSGSCQGVSLRPNAALGFHSASGLWVYATCSSFGADALGGVTMPTACAPGMDVTSYSNQNGCTPSTGGYGCYCYGTGCTSPYPQNVGFPVQSAVNPSVGATYQQVITLNSNVPNLPSVAFQFAVAVESPNSSCWQLTSGSNSTGPIYP